MAHFAELDNNSVVVNVVVVNNDVLLDDGVESEAKGIAFLQSLYGHDRWKQTSYNATMRRNYAGVGYRYDQALDAYISPQPYPSWQLDTTAARWVPPTPYPDDGNRHVWHEASQSWVPYNE